MIIPPDVNRKHALLEPYVAEVANRVSDVVRQYCDTKGFAYMGRMKGANSLAEKLETGRFERWSALDDFFGCTVIVPTLEDEAPTITLIQDRFETVGLMKRGTTRKDPSTFRFDATRFVGRLRQVDFPVPSPILNVSFEIQIRTAFEHAWSVTTHALAYKGQVTDWKRIRLAAQLKAAVEQLDLLVLGRDTVAPLLGEHPWPQVAAKATIEHFFVGEVATGRIPSEVAPMSWVRFSENLFSVLLGATDRYVRDPLPLVDKALAAVATEIEQLTPDTFPRSVSLLQFCMGALVNHKLLTGPLRNYTPVLTNELRSLYPDVTILGHGFDFEIEADSQPFVVPAV